MGKDSGPEGLFTFEILSDTQILALVLFSIIILRYMHTRMYSKRNKKTQTQTFKNGYTTSMDQSKTDDSNSTMTMNYSHEYTGVNNQNSKDAKTGSSSNSHHHFHEAHQPHLRHTNGPCGACLSMGPKLSPRRKRSRSPMEQSMLPRSKYKTKRKATEYQAKENPPKSPVDWTSSDSVSSIKYDSDVVRREEGKRERGRGRVDRVDTGEVRHDKKIKRPQRDMAQINKIQSRIKYSERSASKHCERKFLAGTQEKGVYHTFPSTSDRVDCATQFVSRVPSHTINLNPSMSYVDFGSGASQDSLTTTSKKVEKNKTKNCEKNDNVVNAPVWEDEKLEKDTKAWAALRPTTKPNKRRNCKDAATQSPDREAEKLCRTSTETDKSHPKLKKTIDSSKNKMTNNSCWASSDWNANYAGNCVSLQQCGRELDMLIKATQRDYGNCSVSQRDYGNCSVSQLCSYNHNEYATDESPLETEEAIPDTRATRLLSFSSSTLSSTGTLSSRSAPQLSHSRSSIRKSKPFRRYKVRHKKLSGIYYHPAENVSDTKPEGFLDVKQPSFRYTSQSGPVVKKRFNSNNVHNKKSEPILLEDLLRELKTLTRKINQHFDQRYVIVKRKKKMSKAFTGVEHSFNCSASPYKPNVNAEFDSCVDYILSPTTFTVLPSEPSESLNINVDARCALPDQKFLTNKPNHQLHFKSFQPLVASTISNRKKIFEQICPIPLSETEIVHYMELVPKCDNPLAGFQVFDVECNRSANLQPLEQAYSHTKKDTFSGYDYDSNPMCRRVEFTDISSDIQSPRKNLPSVTVKHHNWPEANMETMSKGTLGDNEQDTAGIDSDEYTYIYKIPLNYTTLPSTFTAGEDFDFRKARKPKKIYKVRKDIEMSHGIPNKKADNIKVGSYVYKFHKRLRGKEDTSSLRKATNPSNTSRQVSSKPAKRNKTRSPIQKPIIIDSPLSNMHSPLKSTSPQKSSTKRIFKLKPTCQTADNLRACRGKQDTEHNFSKRSRRIIKNNKFHKSPVQTSLKISVSKQSSLNKNVSPKVSTDPKKLGNLKTTLKNMIGRFPHRKTAPVLVTHPSSPNGPVESVRLEMKSNVAATVGQIKCRQKQQHQQLRDIHNSMWSPAKISPGMKTTNLDKKNESMGSPTKRSPGTKTTNGDKKKPKKRKYLKGESPKEESDVAVCKAYNFVMAGSRSSHSITKRKRHFSSTVSHKASKKTHTKEAESTAGKPDKHFARGRSRWGGMVEARDPIKLSPITLHSQYFDRIKSLKDSQKNRKPSSLLQKKPTRKEILPREKKAPEKHYTNKTSRRRAYGLLGSKTSTSSTTSLDLNYQCADRDSYKIPILPHRPEIKHSKPNTSLHCTSLSPNPSRCNSNEVTLGMSVGLSQRSSVIKALNQRLSMFVRSVSSSDWTESGSVANNRGNKTTQLNCPETDGLDSRHRYTEREYEIQLKDKRLGVAKFLGYYLISSGGSEEGGEEEVEEETSDSSTSFLLDTLDEVSQSLSNDGKF